MEPPPTTLARTVSWSIALNSGHTQPGKAGPYAHHLGPVRRGEACLALVGAAAVAWPRWQSCPSDDACAHCFVEHRLEFRTHTARQSRALRPPSGACP